MLEFAQAAFAVVGLPWEKYVRVDPVLQRRSEPGQLVGQSAKIQRVLGWKPTRTFHDLVREMVEADLAALAS